jgi:hypothetical protein
MAYRFAPRVCPQAVADFHKMRVDPAAPLPRVRRRAAARAGWGAVSREPQEGWVDFWRACQAARG